MDKKEIVKGHIAVIMPMIDKLIEQFKYLPAEQLIQKIKEAIEEIGKTVEVSFLIKIIILHELF